MRESIVTLSRSPVRTMLNALGPALAIATATAVIGLSESAAGAVSNTFNALEATMVVFTNNSPAPDPPDLTPAAERPLDRLNGVVTSGLVWQLGGQGTYFQVRRTAEDTQRTYRLPVTAASANGLAVIGARILTGRLFDGGMDKRIDMVALLGSEAAGQLGISSVGMSPVIYVGNVPLTVIGIVDRAPLDPGALLGVIIPDSAAAALDGPQGALQDRQIVVHTKAGAAQLVGRQGAYAIDPYRPGDISPQVPVNPVQLRESVSASLTALLLAVACLTLAIGVIAIANMTLLSVISRRAEIGLRRSVGAAPKHIAVLVLSETGLTGTVGGLIGVSAGVLVIAILCASRQWAPVLTPWLLLAAPVGGTAAGFLAGIYPAWRASLVNPIEALQR
jgi:putative ABC transport system permease protein